MSLTKPSASQIMFKPSGVGAVVRSVESKLRDFVSVFDFMTDAEITDVKANTQLVDVTLAVQTALSKVNSGIRIYFPSGTYLISSELVITNGYNFGGIIEGDSFAAYSPGQPSGTFFKFVPTYPGGITSALVIHGLSSPAYLCIRNITFLGEPTITNGVLVDSVSVFDFIECGFVGFTKVDSFSCLLTRLSTDVSYFTGIINFIGCSFSDGYSGVHIKKENTNVIHFNSCSFSTLNKAVVSGELGTLMATRDITFAGCRFEQNLIVDIQSNGGAQDWSIQNCYFEWTSQHTPIEFNFSASSPIDVSIAVDGNTFAGPLSSGGSYLKIAYADGLSFRNNFAASSVGLQYYGVYHTSAAVGSAKNFKIEQMNVVYGEVPPITAYIYNSQYFDGYVTTSNANHITSSIVAKNFYSSKSTPVNCLDGVATVVYTMESGLGPSIYECLIYIANTQDAAYYSATAKILTDGITSRLINSSNGAGMVISLSGLNILCAQYSGAARLVLTSLIRLS
jgi:hypothetical protein